MSDFDFSKASPDDFKVPGQEPAAAEPAPAPADPAPANPAPAEPAPAPDPAPAPAPSKETNEPAREIQFKDDFIKGVVEFYEKTGDLTPYLQAKSVDFTKMTDEEVMRRNLREQYSELSDKAFDKLFKQEVMDKYKLDSEEWGQDEAELGRELLKVEASKLRNKYLDWQKNFQAPEPVSSDDNTQELIRQFEETVKANDLTKAMLADKKISINVGEESFQFEVPEAERLLEMTVDNDKFFSQFAGPDGQLDYSRWYKTAAYSQNPEMFEKALINFGKAQGRAEVTKDLKNPSSPQVGDVPTESSGDFMSGLLQAFANRGVSK